MTDTPGIPGGQAPTPETPAPLDALRPEVPAPAGGAKPGWSGAMTFGVMLILVGVALTVGRYVPGLSLANAWPLIIVVLGVISVLRSRDVYGVLDGSTTILVGGILLMNTMGRLSWGVWLGIFSLWPLLLVALGISIIGRAVGQTWLKALSHLVIIGGLLYGALLMPAGSTQFPLFVTSWPTGPTKTFSATTDGRAGAHGVTRGTATVEWGAAEVSVGPGPGSTIAAIAGDAPSTAPPVLDLDVSGGRAAVRVGAASGSVVGGSAGKLALTLGREVRWEDVVLRVGGTSSRVDLRDLTVDKVELDTGASDTTIILGERTRAVVVKISGGAANVVLRVPGSASVRVHTQGPMASSYPVGFARVKGNLFDEQWERLSTSGTTEIDVSVDGGMLAFRVEEY
jgi:hypothetical protein